MLSLYCLTTFPYYDAKLNVHFDTNDRCSHLNKSLENSASQYCFFIKLLLIT